MWKSSRFARTRSKLTRTPRPRRRQSVVAQSEMNAGLRGVGGDLESLLSPGCLVVADLTDPLLAREDANALFQARYCLLIIYYLFFYLHNIFI